MRSPGLSRMGRCAPARAPLSLSGPAVLSRLAQGRASSTMTLSQPPQRSMHGPWWGSWGSHRVRNIYEGRPCRPLLVPWRCHLCVLACPPAKVQDEPSSAMSVNKKDHTSPPVGFCLCFLFIHLKRASLLLHWWYKCIESTPAHPPSLSSYNSAPDQATLYNNFHPPLKLLEVIWITITCAPFSAKIIPV